MFYSHILFVINHIYMDLIYIRVRFYQLIYFEEFKSLAGENIFTWLPRV